MKKSKESYVAVFVTASSKTEARRIARGVLAAHLAACVNILDGIESHYWWKQKMESAREYLLVMKTTRRTVPALTKTVKELHSYETPEIIALPIVVGSRAYLDWISENTKRKP